MAQNPNINFTTANSIINVNGTIVKAINVNDPSKYSAGQPVDPNSNDPLIEGLNYTIDGGPNGTGKVSYSKNGVNYDSLNSYAQSPAVRFGGGYTANTTKNIQTAMQKNLATAISTSLPTQPSAQNPNPGGNIGITAAIPGVGALSGLTDLLNLFGPGLPGIENLNFSSTNEEQLFSDKALLKYPRDILDNKQDTLQITMYNYQAPLGDTFLPRNGQIDAGSIFKKGLQRNSALKKPIGTVILPIPSGIQDNNAISWGDDTMNSINAGAAGYAINNTGTFATGFGALALGGAALNAATGAQLPIKGMAGLLSLGAAGLRPDNPMLKPAVVSALLNAAGFEVSAESILARGAGIVPNSNLELLFQGPTLRQFGFTWRMSPRSELEAKNVKRIIRFFKQGSSPRKVNSQSGAGANSLFLGTPNVFKLSYKTAGNKEISGLNKFKICALVNMSVVYAPDGQWAAYDEGQPVSLTMTLNFQEIEPVYESDYQTNLSDEFKGNLRLDNYSPVKPDDVGY
jgi:hypothetical protein